MTETVHVYAGDCAITYADSHDERRQRGRVAVVHKPDGTVLVHDVDGYQPVEWLTRADAVHREQGEDGSFALVAVKDGERLRVEGQGDADRSGLAVTPAGVPVGTCPDCDGQLVRARGEVTCLDCAAEYGLPRDAAILDDTCDCGLPRMAIHRGERFELCVDRECERLDAAVRERFDREWSCPDCDGDLRVLRERTLFLGCENYPDCGASFALPDGNVAGTCDCGLPLVAADGDDATNDGGPDTTDGDNTTDDSGSWCLDRDCEGTPEAI